MTPCSATAGANQRLSADFSPTPALHVVWTTGCNRCSGFGAETVQFVLALEGEGHYRLQVLGVRAGWAAG